MCPPRKIPPTVKDKHTHNMGKRLTSASVMIKDDAEHPSRKPPWTVRFHKDVSAPGSSRDHAKKTSSKEHTLTPGVLQAKENSGHAHQQHQHHRHLPLRDRLWHSRSDPAILFKEGCPKESVPLTHKRPVVHEDTQVYSHGHKRTTEVEEMHSTNNEDDPRWHRLYHPHPTNWAWNVSE